MAEYINTTTLLKELDHAFHTDTIGKKDVINLIINLPAADVAEVVRCWQCKHCDPENHHCDHHMGTVAPLRREPDDFCSYGERKGDDDNG